VSGSSFSQEIYWFKVYTYICNALGVMVFVQAFFKELKKRCGIACRKLKFCQVQTNV